MRSPIGKYMIAFTLACFAGSQLKAQTATFDELDGHTVNNTNAPVPPGYALPGLVWTNWASIAAAETFPNAKHACAISSPNCAYNDNGDPASISRAIPFDFTSGYFMSWADQSPGVTCNFNCAMTLVVTGYNGGSVVGSTTTILSPTTPELITFNFSNVDLVTFYTRDDAAWYLADNLVFNNNVVGPVPEPASLTLLATGMIGVFGAARRRRSTSARLLHGGATEPKLS